MDEQNGRGQLVNGRGGGAYETIAEELHVYDDPNWPTKLGEAEEGESEVIKNALAIFWYWRLRLLTLELLDDAADSAITCLASDIVQQQRLASVQRDLMTYGYSDMRNAIADLERTVGGLSKSQIMRLRRFRVTLMEWQPTLIEARDYPHRELHWPANTPYDWDAPFQRVSGFMSAYETETAPLTEKLSILDLVIAMDIQWRQGLGILWQDLDTAFRLVPESRMEPRQQNKLTARCVSLDHRMQINQVIFQLLRKKGKKMTEADDVDMIDHLEGFLSQHEEVQELVRDCTTALELQRDSVRVSTPVGEETQSHNPEDSFSELSVPVTDEDRSGENEEVCEDVWKFLLDRDLEWELAGNISRSDVEPLVVENIQILDIWHELFEGHEASLDANGLVRHIIQLLDIMFGKADLFPNPLGFTPMIPESSNSWHRVNLASHEQRNRSHGSSPTWNSAPRPSLQLSQCTDTDFQGLPHQSGSASQRAPRPS